MKKLGILTLGVLLSSAAMAESCHLIVMASKDINKTKTYQSQYEAKGFNTKILYSSNGYYNLSIGKSTQKESSVILKTLKNKKKISKTAYCSPAHFKVVTQKVPTISKHKTPVVKQTKVITKPKNQPLKTSHQTTTPTKIKNISENLQLLTTKVNNYQASKVALKQSFQKLDSEYAKLQAQYQKLQEAKALVNNLKSQTKLTLLNIKELNRETSDYNTETTNKFISLFEHFVKNQQEFRKRGKTQADNIDKRLTAEKDLLLKQNNHFSEMKEKIQQIEYRVNNID